MRFSVSILVPAKCSVVDFGLTADEHAIQLASGSENEALRDLVLEELAALGGTWTVRLGRVRIIKVDGVGFTCDCTCDKNVAIDREKLQLAIDQRIAERARKDAHEPDQADYPASVPPAANSDAAPVGIAGANGTKRPKKGKHKRRDWPGSRGGGETQVQSPQVSQAETGPGTGAEEVGVEVSSPRMSEVVHKHEFTLEPVDVSEPEVRTVDSCTAVRVLRFRRAPMEHCLWELTADGKAPARDDILTDLLAGKKIHNQGLWRLAAKPDCSD